jgi:hypothetical protein
MINTILGIEEFLSSSLLCRCALTYRAQNAWWGHLHILYRNLVIYNRAPLFSCHVSWFPAHEWASNNAFVGGLSSNDLHRFRCRASRSSFLLHPGVQHGISHQRLVVPLGMDICDAEGPNYFFLENNVQVL